MKKDEKINWKVYPTKIVEEVARDHGYEIGEFLYEIAVGELPRSIMEELDRRTEDAKEKK